MFSLNCQQYKITDEKTGETLKNFEIRKKDLITADRAYATITGMEYCLENGGDFILRIRNKAFNLYNAEREQVFLTDWLKTLDGGASCAMFYYRDSQKNYKPVRICALLKTEEEIKKEEKRIKRKESRKQIKISDDTKFSHRYMFVATSLPETFTAEDILGIYRLRWRVEMVFKRYKSIPGHGRRKLSIFFPNICIIICCSYFLLKALYIDIFHHIHIFSFCLPFPFYSFFPVLID